MPPHERLEFLSLNKGAVAELALLDLDLAVLAFLVLASGTSGAGLLYIIKSAWRIYGNGCMGESGITEIDKSPDQSLANFEERAKEETVYAINEQTNVHPMAGDHCEGDSM